MILDLLVNRSHLFSEILAFQLEGGFDSGLNFVRDLPHNMLELGSYIHNLFPFIPLCIYYEPCGSAGKPCGLVVGGRRGAASFPCGGSSLGKAVQRWSQPERL
jgi:hypothetical protein